MPRLRLAVEPIPCSSHRASLANLLSPNQWDQIRRSVYRKAGHRCQICGREERLYCHEKWQYNENTGYQYLMGFEALCEKCHKVRHFFFVRVPLQRAILFQHFLAVNRMSWDEGIQHLEDVYRQQQRLNQREWIVHYGQYNWQVPATKNIQQRRNYAKSNHPTYR